jgi:hypothetical protein
MDATASVRRAPSSTNTGYIRSSALRCDSRINRLENSSRRILRMRVAGKPTFARMFILDPVPDSIYKTTQLADQGRELPEALII